MPSRPKKPCRKHGCNKLVELGYCEEHKKEEYARDSRRGNSFQRGYDSRWRRARLGFLARHPLCVTCYSEGKIVPATDVDHIVPHRGDRNLFWDVKNWQPLCKSCHSRKTADGK